MLYGVVADYGLRPQNRVSVTLTLIYPNPRSVGNILVRQDPIGVNTITNGYFAFTNIQWGHYSLSIGGVGTVQDVWVQTNTSGTVAIAGLVSNSAAIPPNPSTNYYTMSQVDALLAGVVAGGATPVFNTNQIGTNAGKVQIISGAAITNAVISGYTNRGDFFSGGASGPAIAVTNSTLKLFDQVGQAITFTGGVLTGSGFDLGSVAAHWGNIYVDGIYEGGSNLDTLINTAVASGGGFRGTFGSNFNVTTTTNITLSNTVAAGKGLPSFGVDGRVTGTNAIVLANIADAGSIAAYPSNGFVSVSRIINTTAPLTGGGAMSADLTLAMAAGSALVNGYMSTATYALFNGKQAGAATLTNFATVDTNVFAWRSNNLSDLSSASTARGNLGLGSSATFASSAFAQTANNLSDLGSVSTARGNLGLGTAATQSTGTFAQVVNNLSDLNSASTARANLGLGTAAVQNVGAFAQVVNNGSDFASKGATAGNVGVKVISVSGGDAYDYWQGATPAFEGQLGLSYYGGKTMNVVASGSTTTGDWQHGFNFQTGVANLGDPDFQDSGISTAVNVHLNGNKVNWTNAGDSLLNVFNWSSSSNNSGPGVNLSIMVAGTGVNTFSVASGGSGYAVGDLVSLVGGTKPLSSSQRALLRVAAVSSGAITTLRLVSSGEYTSNPSSPNSLVTESGGGSGATATVTFTSKGVRVMNDNSSSFNYVPTNRLPGLIPGNTMLVFNKDNNFMRGFSISSPGASGYDGGNYSYFFADIRDTGKNVGFPFWVAGKYQPADSGWKWSLVAYPLTGVVALPSGAEFQTEGVLRLGTGATTGTGRLFSSTGGYYRNDNFNVNDTGDVRMDNSVVTVSNVVSGSRKAYAQSVSVSAGASSGMNYSIETHGIGATEFGTGGIPMLTLTRGNDDGATGGYNAGAAVTVGYGATNAGDITGFATLQVLGSFGAYYTNKTTNYTLTSTDSTVVFNGASLTCTLPDATYHAKSREYTIKNDNATALTFSGSIDGTNSITLAQGRTINIRSDGSGWVSFRNTYGELDAKAPLASPTFTGTVTAPTIAVATQTVGNQTLTNNPTWPAATSNTMWAGPTSGSAAAPTMRAMTASDIPAGLTPVFNGSGITNLTLTNLAGLTTNGLTVIRTNFAVATPWTNTYGYPVIVAECMAVLSEASVAGRSGIGWTVTGANGCSNSVSQVTAIGIATGATSNGIPSLLVDVSGVVTFTDISTGAGNSATVVGGQVAYIQQLSVANSGTFTGTVTAATGAIATLTAGTATVTNNATLNTISANGLVVTNNITNKGAIVGNTATLNSGTVSNLLTTTYLAFVAGTPTIVTNTAGAGVSSSASFDTGANDSRGVLSITTGASGTTANSLAATVLFSTAKAAADKTVILTPANNNASSMSLIRTFTTNYTTTGFEIWAGTVAWSASALLKYNYMCIQ